MIIATITVERGVDMPHGGRGWKDSIAAAFAIMKPGDSFTVTSSNTRKNVHMISKRLGAKVRSLPTGPDLTYRYQQYRFWLLTKARA